MLLARRWLCIPKSPTEHQMFSGEFFSGPLIVVFFNSWSLGSCYETTFNAIHCAARHMQLRVSFRAILQRLAGRVSRSRIPVVPTQWFNTFTIYRPQQCQQWHVLHVHRDKSSPHHSSTAPGGLCNADMYDTCRHHELRLSHVWWRCI